MKVQTIRDGLADQFESRARWREMQAEEYPEDARNVWSSAALRELAAYVRSLPDDDPTLRRLIDDDEVLGYFETGDGLTGEEVDRMVSEYGFHGTDAPEVFLAGLVDQALADWVNSLADADPDGFKVLENKVRRMAARQRLKITKSRRRDTRAYDFGTYTIADERTNLVAGEYMDLGDVIRYLTAEARQ